MRSRVAVVLDLRVSMEGELSSGETSDIPEWNRQHHPSSPTTIFRKLAISSGSIGSEYARVEPPPVMVEALWTAMASAPALTGDVLDLERRREFLNAKIAELAGGLAKMESRAKTPEQPADEIEAFFEGRGMGGDQARD